MRKISDLINLQYLNHASNPFDREGVKNILFEPAWVGYTFGSLLLLLGITCFFFYKPAKRKADKYRNEQLIEFNKKFPNKKTTNYSLTGMFLPAWQKAKLFAPIFFGLVFCIIGIAWLTGNTLTSL